MNTNDNLSLNILKGFVSVPDRLKYLDKTENLVVLAIWGEDTPYASIVNFVITNDLKSVIFVTPKTTQKYRNIQKSKQVVILIDNRASTLGHLTDTEAVTIIRKARVLKKGKLLDVLRNIYISKLPNLEGFVNAKTTAMISVDIYCCIHVSKFQTVTLWNCI